jgi:hypothetical protein
MIIFVRTSSKTLVDELKKQLNSYLLTELQINDIRISSLKNFPNITVVLDHVVIKEFPKESGKNLAELDNIYLVINLLDFIKKDYNIQKIICSHGNISIKRYNDGIFNYEIFKPAEKVETASNVDFKIKKASFQDVNFFYIDNLNDFDCSTIVIKADFKGNLTSSPYKMDVFVKSVGIVSHYNKKSYEHDDNIELHTALNYNSEEKIFELLDTKLIIDKNKIEIDGSYMYNLEKKFSSFNISLNAESIKTETIIDYLPDIYKNGLLLYNIKGNLDLKARIEGVYNKKRFPSINLSFRTDNSEISHKTEKFAVEKLKLSGEFSNNGKSSLKDFKLTITEFSGITDKNNFSGRIALQDFIEPYINLSFKSKIKLISLNPFLKNQAVKFDSGSADLDIIYIGRLKEMKTFNEHEKVDVKLILENAGLTIHSDTRISDLNTNMHIDDKQAVVNTFSGKVNQTSISFKGSITGLVSYLLKSSLNLQVNGDLAIDKIDITKKNKISNKYQQSFILPALNGLDFDVNLQLGELNIPGFYASQIKGNVKVKNENIIAKGLNFKTPYGSGVLTGMLSKSPHNEITFEGQSDLSKVDLNKLFVQFRNFGQNNLTSKNLKGLADANIQIIFSFDSNFNFIESNLYALADITITNGELNNYQTIQNLFGFIKLKKMNNIVFDKIQNTIIIKDREISIPKMVMNSSAFNMEVQGRHTFDNQIEYNLKINVTKLFFGKNKIDRKQFENAEDDSKGGINMYVTVYGDASDPKYKFSKSTVGTKVNDGLKNQKKEIKEIIKRQKDKTKNNQNNNNNDYELQWDDN